MASDPPAELEKKTVGNFGNHDTHAEILPGLWIGSLAAVHHVSSGDSDVQWTIISILDSEKLIRLSKALMARSSNIRHEIWNLPDKGTADFLSGRLSTILDMIDDSLPSRETPKKGCLVHCAQGISRSAALCAAWYMTRKKTSLEQALAIIRQVRPQALPNLGFIACLRAIEQCDGDIQSARKRMDSKRRILNPS
jgi:protein-tyrosine phosphatase